MRLEADLEVVSQLQTRPGHCFAESAARFASETCFMKGPCDLAVASETLTRLVLHGSRTG